MPTARDIITQAYDDAGISGTGLTLSAPLINKGFKSLNDLLAQWQGTRWMVYHLNPIDLPMTGATNYSVGPGGLFNLTARPDRLEAARIIQKSPPPPNDVGWPLKEIGSMEGYNNIRMQHLGSFPQFFFYDSDFPLGFVYFWPLPSSLYTARIITKEILPQFVTLNDDIGLPGVYFRALRFTLAEELRMANGMPERPDLKEKATGAREVIKVANFQLPVLEMPEELVRRANYNVFSDNTI
jgi:hypothetical protein